MKTKYSDDIVIAAKQFMNLISKEVGELKIGVSKIELRIVLIAEEPDSKEIVDYCNYVRDNYIGSNIQ